MKSKKLFLPTMIFCVTIVAMIVFSIVNGIAQKPVITENEFPFSITYEIDGKEETSEGVYAGSFVNPYEGSLSMFQSEAIEYMSANAEQNIECLKALFHIVAPYPVGTKVRLSNGLEGIVVKNFPELPLRPAIIASKEVVLLHKDPVYRNITISEVLKK